MTVHINLSSLADDLRNFFCYRSYFDSLGNRLGDAFDYHARTRTFFVSFFLFEIVGSRRHPILLKRAHQIFNCARVTEDQSNLAPGIEFNLPQALAPHEHIFLIAHNGSCVQAHPLQFATLKMFSRCAPEDADLHARILSFDQQPQHRSIADVGVIDEQLFFRPFDEPGQLVPRIHRTYHKLAASRGIYLPLGISLEEFHAFRDQSAVSGDQAKASATVNVQIREIKSQQVELFPVHYDHLSVISHQIACRPGDSDSVRQKPFFELAQVCFAAPVRKRNQSVDKDPSLHSVGQCTLDLRPIKAKNQYFDTLLGLSNALYQAYHSVSRLYQ